MQNTPYQLLLIHLPEDSLPVGMDEDQKAGVSVTEHIKCWSLAGCTLNSKLQITTIVFHVSNRDELHLDAKQQSKHKTKF